MEQPPEPQYRVIEREGRLIVEQTSEKPAAPKRKLPTPPALRFDPMAIGRSLLAKAHSFDMTADGNALLTASQLHDYILLSARPHDLYYLTPRQQAIIGYLTIQKNPQYLMITALAAVAAFVIFGVAFIIIAFIVSATAGTYFKNDYDAIHQQQYFPEGPTPA